VPEIERTIRTIKERNRANVDGLPFVNYPKLMKIEMLKNAVTWLNMFPHPDGVSDTITSQTIMTGIKVKFATHCRVPFGAYGEVHNENDPSNTTLPRTSKAIALNPTGNLQGSYYFMSLATGKRISRRRWTELPVTEEIIERVHDIALMEATYDADVPDFQFAWGANDPIEDVEIEDVEIEDAHEQVNNEVIVAVAVNDNTLQVVEANHLDDGDETKKMKRSTLKK
jgi:hypothetical protein